MKTYIYTLECPITNEIRYVGKTIDINKRYYQHISLSKLKKIKNKHLSNWILTLANKQVLPKIEIIDETDSIDWEWLEQYWISQFKTWGFRLVNLTMGGEGFRGNHSKETKLKLSKSHKGKTYKVSEEELFRRRKFFKEFNPMFNLDIKNKIIQKVKESRGFTKTKQFSENQRKNLLQQIKNGNHPHHKKVIKLTLDDIIICEYKSIKDCCLKENKSFRQVKYLLDNEHVRNTNFKLKYG